MTKSRHLIVIGLAGLVSMAIYLQSKETLKTSNLKLTQIAGHELFSQKKCSGCHTLGNEAEGKLTPVSEKHDNDWLTEHVSSETEIVLDDAKSAGKRRRILKKEVVALEDFLFQSTAPEKQQVISLPVAVRQGAFLAYQNNCTNCHAIAGDGKEIGPDLTYIADRKDKRAWHIKNLKNPQQFADDSPMPAFEGKLTENEIGKIVDYLLTLRK